MYHFNIGNQGMQSLQDDEVLHQLSAAENIEVVKLIRLENQILRENNNYLTRLNNNLQIEISRLNLQIEMFELKKALCQEGR